MNSTSPSAQRGQHRRQVAGALDGRAAGDPDRRAELGGDDHRRAWSCRGRAARTAARGRAAGRAAARSSTSCSCSRTRAWPTNSASRLGRSAASTARSSGVGQRGCHQVFAAGARGRGRLGFLGLAQGCVLGHRRCCSLQLAQAARSTVATSTVAAVGADHALVLERPRSPGRRRARPAQVDQAGCDLVAPGGRRGAARPAAGRHRRRRARSGRAARARSAPRPSGRCRAPWSARAGRRWRRRGAARPGCAPPASPGPAAARPRWPSAAARTRSARRRRRSRTASASPPGPPGWWRPPGLSPTRARPACPGCTAPQADPADLDDRAVRADARPPGRADGDHRALPCLGRPSGGLAQPPRRRRARCDRWPAPARRRRRPARRVREPQQPGDHGRDLGLVGPPAAGDRGLDLAGGVQGHRQPAPRRADDRDRAGLRGAHHRAHVVLAEHPLDGHRVGAALRRARPRSPSRWRAAGRRCPRRPASG